MIIFCKECEAASMDEEGVHRVHPLSDILADLLSETPVLTILLVSQSL